MRFNTRAMATMVLAVSALATACDFKDPLEGVQIKLDVQDAPITVSNASVVAKAGQPAVSTTTVNSPSDIESIDDLKVIRFKPADFTYTNSGAFQTSNAMTMNLTQASGTVSVLVMVAGIPIPGTPIQVTISNNVVTSVTPAALDLRTAVFSKSAIEALINSLPAGSRPALPAGWATMTEAQAKAAIQEALANDSFSLTFVVNATGDLNGTLRINGFSIDALVSSEA
jgi:hypothetical protein